MAVNVRYTFWIIEQHPNKGANAKEKPVITVLSSRFFRILPFVAASCYRLVPLPVEIWSTILRNLDPLSLLSIARSDPVCLDICRGDTVLKKILRRTKDGKSCLGCHDEPTACYQVPRGLVIEGHVLSECREDYHSEEDNHTKSVDANNQKKNNAPSINIHQDMSKKQNKRYSPYRL
ncbi:hypothetical protein JTB14_032886 [Gonioctena quinquepunctata]|nr:hypothetical protein JTB14_032886 [Gonioctena quinquepunctata]